MTALQRAINTFLYAAMEDVDGEMIIDPEGFNQPQDDLFFIERVIDYYRDAMAWHEAADRRLKRQEQREKDRLQEIFYSEPGGKGQGFVQYRLLDIDLIDGSPNVLMANVVKAIRNKYSLGLREAIAIFNNRITRREVL